MEHQPVSRRHTEMIVVFLLILSVRADIPKKLDYLNDLPLDKLIQLKSSLQELVTPFENATTPIHHETFGAQAMALNAPPLKRTDYGVYKKDTSAKLNTLFTMSVTTLAFLAFGGYLLCLIVQAVKAKHSISATTTTPTTFLINAGIKKKPQSHFASYGRRKRRVERSLPQLDLPPEQMFEVLLKLCESYAKWSERYESYGAK